MQKSVLFRTQKCKFQIFSVLNASRVESLNSNEDPLIEPWQSWSRYKWYRIGLRMSENWIFSSIGDSESRKIGRNIRRKFKLQIRLHQHFHRWDILISMRKKRNHFWHGSKIQFMNHQLWGETKPFSKPRVSIINPILSLN